MSSSAKGDDVSSPGLRFWLLVGSHTLVDLYPPFIFALAVALQDRLALSEAQVALVFAINPIVSGLSQPLVAWLTDKLNTRLFGALGLMLAAIGMSSIGLAQSFGQLVTLQVIGMIGTGVFHPVGSAVAGQLSGRHRTNRSNGRSSRGLGLSIFFAAGMFGGMLGPKIATGINAAPMLGMPWLAVMAAPGLIGAVVLWLATADVPHRAPTPKEDASEALSDLRLRWITVALLYLSNTLRFTTNIGLFYVYEQWVKGRESETVHAASAHSSLLSISSLGMGVSALLVGRFLRAGHEKSWMALSALVTAPIILMMPGLNSSWMMVAAAAASIGYFSVIPSSLGLAQRLLPHATGWVGSLLMGCGWAVSALGPLLARQLIESSGLRAAFYAFAAMMLLAGAVSMLLPGKLIHATAEAHQ